MDHSGGVERGRVRLLAVHGMAERGGSDFGLLRTLRALPADRFAVHVAVPAPHPLAAALAGAGATLHVVPMRRISGSHRLADWVRYALAWPLTVLRLVALGRRTGADVVYTNSLHFWHGWAAALLLRRPHVWHAREIVVQSGAALRLERLLTRRFADRVVAVSQAVADQLDRDDVVVVHEHPDPAEFSPERAGRFRGAAGIDDQAPLAGIAGRIDVWKGVDVVLDAWPTVRAQHPDAQLVVAGGPVEGKQAYAEGLARRAGSLDGVSWLGPREDVPDLLADLDVLVLASTEPEPYGLVLVEALASGCPVVATDAGGAPEIVRAARPGAGRLVPPGDADALAAAVTACLGARPGDGAAGRRGRPVLSRPAPSPVADLLHDTAEARR